MKRKRIDIILNEFDRIVDLIEYLMCRMAPVITTMSGVWSLKMEPRMKCWKQCVIASDWCIISRNVC